MTFLCKFMRTYFRASALFRFQKKKYTYMYVFIMNGKIHTKLLLEGDVQYWRIYAIPYIIYYNLNIMLLLAFLDIFESMFIFQFRIWNRGIMSSISQRLCNVHDDVRKKVYRRSIKPHCIHICKVNCTILCEIRYQKFTGVKPCLKYSNGNRNDLQSWVEIWWKQFIHIYIYI